MMDPMSKKFRQIISKELNLTRKEKDMFTKCMEILVNKGFIELTTQPLLCPKCTRLMVLKTATKGINDGLKFYGCSGFPKCNGVRNIPYSLQPEPEPEPEVYYEEFDILWHRMVEDRKAQGLPTH